MRILYLSQYYPPEIGATQTRAYEMATNLVKLGHQVTVITELPNHPTGVTHPDYRGKRFVRETIDGVDIVRVWVKSSPQKTFTNRILFYLTYAINASLAGSVITRDPYDLIYASSPPLFVGGAALFLSWIKRVPMYFEVRDLWPESAVELGELKNSTAIKFASKLEEKCYRSASRIIVVTKGIQNNLIARGIDSEKIVFIPNGANISLFNFRQGARNKIREHLDLESRFVVIYAGIFGIAQGLETVIEAARILSSQKGIRFILIGEGPTKDRITELVQESAIENTIILPQVPRTEIPDFLSASDLSIILLRDIELFKGALPSKMFDSWACERPILLCVDGEARQVMEEASGGFYVPPEDAVKLAEKIVGVSQTPDDLLRMGKNAREYTERFYSREALALKLSDLLLSNYNKW